MASVTTERDQRRRVATHLTHSEAETASVGRALAADLSRGDVVLLDGPLGAGKTAFVRGLAEGLGSSPDDVTSPTFTIVQFYRGRLSLQHVDLYRLAPAEVDDLALEDLLEDAAMAVEWPDRWHRAPEDAVRVSIALVDEHTRRIEISRPG
jgi:tRNA threonylcarbamoyladenosine biosynthesis protein TsaE